jgi:hypothetical protein
MAFAVKAGMGMKELMICAILQTVVGTTSRGEFDGKEVHCAGGRINIAYLQGSVGTSGGINR